MAHAKQHENLLLTEHFTWPPISLLDDIINTVNDSLYSCNDTLETGLLSADPAFLGFTPQPGESEEKMHERARLEIEEGAQKLETLMIDAVDKNFDRLEIWTLRNVLCLPREEGFENWVRLGHYEGLKIPPRDNTLTPEALYTLRRKLVETNKLHAALLAEKARNDAQIARLRALLSPQNQQQQQQQHHHASPASEKPTPTAPFAFLTHTPSAQALGIQALPSSPHAPAPANPDPRAPLTTHTTFTTSHLPHLRQLLAQLKPHLAAAALPSGKAGETEERAAERRVYIESQSRRVLERRGVDTRDGVEGVGEGRGVRVEEVRALEGIAGAVEGRGRGQEEEGEVMDVHMDTT